VRSIYGLPHRSLCISSVIAFVVAISFQCILARSSPKATLFRFRPINFDHSKRVQRIKRTTSGGIAKHFHRLPVISEYHPSPKTDNGAKTVVLPTFEDLSRIASILTEMVPHTRLAYDCHDSGDMALNAALIYLAVLTAFSNHNPEKNRCAIRGHVGWWGLRMV
jgi:hypothetical protein